MSSADQLERHNGFEDREAHRDPCTSNLHANRFGGAFLVPFEIVENRFAQTARKPTAGGGAVRNDAGRGVGKVVGHRK